MLSISSSSPPGSRDLTLILGPVLLGAALCTLAFLLVLRPFGCSGGDTPPQPAAERGDGDAWLLGLSGESTSGFARRASGRDD